MHFSIRSHKLLAFSLTIFSVVLVIGVYSIPVRGEINVGGKLLRKLTLKPGESYEGEIAVSNSGDEPTGLEVYESDYLFFSDGSNEYPEPGTIDRSSAQWVDFSLPPEVTIEPGGEFPLSFNINVPNDPSLEGTYWSMIMIQSTPPPAEKPEEGIAVRQVLRYGVQIAVNIGDTGERKIDLLDVKPVERNGSKLVQVNVKNVGQRAVSPIAKVELYDQGGKKYGPFEGSEYMIYPGCSVSYRVPFKEVPDRKYQSVILIDNGDEYVWGARKEIDFSDQRSAGAEEEG